MGKMPILTLDVGSHSLKLAEFVPGRGGLEMTRYAVSELGLGPQASEAEVSQYTIRAIHDLLAESGCKPGPVLVSISGHSAFLRFRTLPPVEKEKLFQVVQYEAQQNVPFPLNEVVWDFQTVPGNGGDVDVLLAAIKSEIITNLCDCIRFAGLTPELVDVSPLSIYNAVRYNYAGLPPCTLVVDIGARSTNLIFIEEGRAFTRNVPVAGNMITQSVMNEFGISFDDAEAMKKAHAYVAFGGAYDGPKSETVDKVSKSVRSMMTRLHSEIMRSINFYRSQGGGQAPELLLLTGGSSVIPYTDSFLREKLKIETDYFNPFNNVAVAENIPTDQIGAHACELGPTVGLALRKLHTCPIEINLLPPKAEEEKKFKKKQPVFGLAAGILLLTLGAWVAYFATMGGQAEAAKDRISDHVKKLEGVERQLKAAEDEEANVERQIGKLTDLERRRGVWRSIYAELGRCLTDGIDGMWLTKISPEIPRNAATQAEEGEEPKVPSGIRLVAVHLEGMGYVDLTQPRDVEKFRDNLRASKLFSDETEIIFQPATRPEDSTLEFHIRAVLEESLEL